MTHGEKAILTVLDRELHDMAQPLASLQCRLEFGRMLADKASLAEAVEGALSDLDRLNAVFSRLRDVLAISGQEHREA